MRLLEAAITIADMRGIQTLVPQGRESRHSQFLKLLIAIAIVAFATARPACGYTDPGSGALIWQMLIAGFVGSFFYIRRFRSWIASWRKNRCGK